MSQRRGSHRAGSCRKRRAAPTLLSVGAVLLAALASCSEEQTSAPAPAPTTTTPPPSCGAAELLLDDGTCLPVGMSPDGCGAGHLLVDQACQPAGVPPSECASGFEPSAGGCRAILPAAACPEGLMAIPGQAECAPVAPCGDGTWGDIPVEADTQYVDGSYLGGDSNGSAERPWTTVAIGLHEAVDGAIVAVAAGTYAEDIVIQRGLRLWGRCPELVELVGIGEFSSTVRVWGKAELHDLAVTGPEIGVVVAGGDDVLLERLWVHDVGDWGVHLESFFDDVHTTLRGCLIESVVEAGLHNQMADASIDGSVIRNVLETFHSAGAVVIDTGVPDSTLTIRDSVIEATPDAGVYVAGGIAVVDATVIRDTGHYGIVADADPGQRARLTLSRSLLERSTDVAVLGYAADVEIDTTTIRDTRLGEADVGRGVSVSAHPDKGGSTLALRWSVVEQSIDTGVFVDGAVATIEGTFIRDVVHSPGQPWGSGLYAADGPDFAEVAQVVVRGAVVAQIQGVGMILSGIPIEVESVHVHDIVPDVISEVGQGIHIQPSLWGQEGADVSLRHSIVERCHTFGVLVIDSRAEILGCAVRDVLPNLADDVYGDGVTATEIDWSTDVTVMASLVERASRAGFTNFGAHVRLEATKLVCNPIDLNAENLDGAEFSFEDLGGNECGCDAAAVCQVQSVQLEAPKPLEP